MSVLSAEDRAFFQQNGYIVVPNAVPQKNLDAVIDVIWDYLGMDRNNPEDWYRPPLTPGGMLEVYQHQALWDNRQYPRLHEIFTDIYGTEKLWVTFDRVNMKPPRHPAHPEYDHKGFIHWDADTAKLPIPFGVQGVLCLTDTAEGMGGFQCVPEIYRRLEEWIAAQPPDRNTRSPKITTEKVIPIPAKAGDIVIWDKLLPHGNGQNVSGRPRLAQYVAMFPAREDNEAYRQERITCWRDRLPPKADWALGDPRRWEQEHGKTAELTPLGRKLLGLDRWEDTH